MFANKRDAPLIREDFKDWEPAEGPWLIVTGEMATAPDFGCSDFTGIDHGPPPQA
jgi:hypothetical protein